MSTSEKVQGIVQYRCKSCNAPYPLGADDVIATCPYCGYTFTVGGGELSQHLFIPNKLDADQVKKSVQKWLEFAASKSVGKGIVSNIEIEQPVLQWIPYFRVKGSTDAYHLGYEKKKSGKQTVLHKVEDTVSDVTTMWILARRHAATFGVKEFLESIESHDAAPFDITQIKDPILNAEITQDDAEPRAKYEKSEKDRAQLQEEMDKLLDYRLNMEIEECAYVHVPYWLVRYEYKGGTFRVAFSGVSGTVVSGELPVTKRYRAIRWLSSLIMLVFSALLFQALPYITVAVLSGSSDSEAFAIPAIVGVIAAVLFGMSFYEVGKVLKYEIRVDAEGNEPGSESLLKKKIFGRQLT